MKNILETIRSSKWEISSQWNLKWQGAGLDNLLGRLKVYDSLRWGHLGGRRKWTQLHFPGSQAVQRRRLEYGMKNIPQVSHLFVTSFRTWLFVTTGQFLNTIWLRESWSVLFCFLNPHTGGLSYWPSYTLIRLWRAWQFKAGHGAKPAAWMGRESE